MTTTKNISFLAKYAELIRITIAVIVSVVGATWAVFAYLEKQQDKKEDLEKTLIEVSQTVKEIRRGQDSLLIRMDDFDRQLDGVHENTVHIGNYVEGVKKAFDYHVKRSPEVSKEDYAKMMELITFSLDKATAYQSFPEPSIVVRKKEY